jgi:Tfp pilus assembly protein PilP
MKTNSLWTLALLAAATIAAPQQGPASAKAAPAKVAPAPAAATPAPVAPAKAVPPAAAATPPPAAAPTGPAGGELIQSILEQELEAPRNGYIYNPAGRRDPFISLARPVAADESSQPRRPGIEGFLLQETSLKGVVKNIDGWIAVLEGPDKKGYFVRVGQRMHDGVITAVDAAGLTFRQEITDPLSPAKSRDVRRLLNSAQEESKQ